MRHTIIRLASACAIFMVPAGSGAQGSVSGEVSILERGKEPTTDIGSAVIYLEPVTPVAKARQKEMRDLIALQARAFQPRVRVVQVGSTVDFPNRDSFNHNVFTSSALGEFDLGVYGQGKSREAKFKRPGIYPIYCNIHARMTGYVLAVTTPYFAHPGIDGRFEIPGVPAGHYTMHVWHERAPIEKRELVVTAEGVSDIRTQLDARRFKRVAHKNKFGQEYKSSGGDRY